MLYEFMLKLEISRSAQTFFEDVLFPMNRRLEYKRCKIRASYLEVSTVKDFY